MKKLFLIIIVMVVVGYALRTYGSPGGGGGGGGGVPPCTVQGADRIVFSKLNLLFNPRQCDQFTFNQFSAYHHFSTTETSDLRLSYLTNIVNYYTAELEESRRSSISVEISGSSCSGSLKNLFNSPDNIGANEIRNVKVYAYQAGAIQDVKVTIKSIMTDGGSQLVWSKTIPIKADNLTQLEIDQMANVKTPGLLKFVEYNSNMPCDNNWYDRDPYEDGKYLQNISWYMTPSCR